MCGPRRGSGCGAAAPARALWVAADGAAGAPGRVGAGQEHAAIDAADHRCRLSAVAFTGPRRTAAATRAELGDADHTEYQQSAEHDDQPEDELAHGSALDRRRDPATRV